ncbi:MAG: FkbM family methyltransferase [Opitutaceae bacterium]|jgi:FkbM family methyltransferase|nr:FkbM family methyltransferase [Opitutaceae bacterium]
MSDLGDVVFDLGAYVGYMTLLAAKTAGTGGRMFAFEPMPMNLGYLNNHVKINRLKNTQVLPYAVSRIAGWRSFDLSKGSGRGGLRPNAKDNTLRVEVVGLDEMVRQGRLPPPNVIKMDIEGEEAEALKGATRIFTTVRPKLFLSTHGGEIRAECESLLSGWNYKIFPIPKADLLAISL